MTEMEKILLSLGLTNEPRLVRILARMQADAEMSGTIDTMTRISQMQQEEVNNLRAALAEHEAREIDSEFMTGACYGLRLACKILSMPEGVEPGKRAANVQERLDDLYAQETRGDSDV